MAEHPPFEGTEFQVKVWNAMKEISRGDGSLGGYSGAGGVETKRRLLSEEGVYITSSRSK